MKYNEILKPLQKNAVRIKYTNKNTKAGIGNSKIGGKPDLPADFEWYYYNGRPLSFLAQINCAEAKQYDKDDLLPSQGMLYFFYEIEEMVWGFDPKDKDGARVYYYSGDLSALESADFPDDLEEDYIIPEMPVSFSSEVNLPDCEEYFGDNYSTEQINDYNNVKYSMLLGIGDDGFDVADYEDDIEEYDDFAVIHKLLGYANIIQSDMLLECEKVSNGIYCGASSDIPEKDLNNYKMNRTQWQLLLQLGTIENDGYEMMWGDCGRVYFYIKKDDLANLIFDNCRLILQCG